MKVNDFSAQKKYSQLSSDANRLIHWLQTKKQCSLEDVTTELTIDSYQAQTLLDDLTNQNFLKVISIDGNNTYVLKVTNKPKKNFLQSCEKKIGRITLSNLIFLTFITAFLLTPFVFSPIYLPILRENNFEFHQFLLRNSYKLITGYIALFFAFLEIILTLRKRGRGWFIKIKIPGSLLLWRSLHIFVGVAFVGVILIHTAGSNGFNFNAIFLWVFFAVTLSALVGVVSEMRVLESSQRFFGGGTSNGNILTQFLPRMSKAQLIRGLRDIWLSSHIFLVNVFFVMLAFHIFMAYYYE